MDRATDSKNSGNYKDTKSMFNFKKNQLIIVWVSIWLAATIFTVGFCVSKFKLVQLYHLINYGIETKGKVMEKFPANHQRIRYSFQFQGQTYYWGGFAEDINKTFDQIALGEEIPVTYEADDPNNSCMGNPKKTFYPNLRLSIFISLLPTIAIALNLFINALKNPVIPKTDLKS